MTIKTFQTEKYRECPVYYRNFLSHFEYLVVIENQIYTAHITILPTAYSRFLSWFGAEKYSKEEYEKILEIIRRMAQTTIDTIKDKK